MYRVLIFSVLFASWLVFSGLFDAFHVPLGLISCGLVTWWASDFLFADRTIDGRGRIAQALRLPGYLGWLLGQIVIANWHVFRLALSPSMRQQMRPQLVKFRSGLRSDFENYVLAQSITLTPGTVTLEIKGDEFLIHAISDEAADGLKGAMPERVRKLFAID